MGILDPGSSEFLELLLGLLLALLHVELVLSDGILVLSGRPDLDTCPSLTRDTSAECL